MRATRESLVRTSTPFSCIYGNLFRFPLAVVVPILMSGWVFARHGRGSTPRRVPVQHLPYGLLCALYSFRSVSIAQSPIGISPAASNASLPLTHTPMLMTIGPPTCCAKLSDPKSGVNSATCRQNLKESLKMCVVPALTASFGIVVLCMSMIRTYEAFIATRVVLGFTEAGT